MKYLRVVKNRLNEIADPTLGGVSYTVQKNPGYTYQILSLNHDLEQKTNKVDNKYYIHPGCRVRGVGLNNPNLHYTGRVHRIVKNGDGSIKYIYIQSEKTNKMVTILADDNLELLIGHGAPPLGTQQTVQASYKASKL